MKKRSVLSLLLALSILLSLALPAATTAYAEGENKTNSGLEMKKTATPNGDGTYTITLEAYATGEKVISEITQDVPTDIVLVLDQSGSMADCMVCGNEIRGNSTHSIYTAVDSVSNNGTYYIKDGSSYTRVYYCNGKHSSGPWTSNCAGGAGWYTDTSRNSHTNNNKLTPKTSSNPNGRQFYTVNTESCTARLDALKTAVTSFANAVAEKAKGKDSRLGTEDDINHRIAVVGFASESGYNDNTELLSIAGRNSGSVGVAYNDITDQNLKDVMQNMDETAGQTMITNAINALAASGATRTDLGMDMAKRILDANPVPENEKRNRVVIVFTDGSPTSSNGFEINIADTAINTATDIKNSGTTVYTIGIFSGADANSAGAKPSNNLKYIWNGWNWVPGYTDAEMSDACNWFMQNLSSNNGTVRSPSYYLSAGDSASLNSIFQQISDNIESGSTSTTLTEETVIKDIISPQFTLPAGATAENITLETYACTGKNGDEYTWSKNPDAMGATATITSTDDSHATTTQNQVNVTGFNFKENYVGTVTENGNVTYRGNKLVIKFNVTPRPGFLGGNGVYTNTEAGIYENGTAEDPVDKFERPDVDVTIKKPDITVPDANVFLGAYFKDTVSADQLKEGTTVSFDDGNITLDLTKGNDKDKPWGLEPWQTEYVDITVTVTDKDGNVVTDFENITEDTDYTVSVSIQPKTAGTSNGTNEKGKGIIHVFTPELTYKDSTAYYGESVPVNNDYSANLTTTQWKHVDGEQTKYSTDKDVTMLGSQTPPTLNITYTPDASKLDGTKYGKQDVPVKAKVSILGVDVTKYTTFLHQNCDVEGCTWAEPTIGGEPAFQVHIKTCQLTITKTGGNNGEPYVFDVYKDGEKYTQVTVVGNTREIIYELPVGTYTIEEDTGWSWRFTGDNGTSAVLDNTAPTGEITCTNTLKTNQWLNGFSRVIRNIFGAAKQ